MSFWKKSPGPSWSHVLFSETNSSPSILIKKKDHPSFSYSLVTSNHCKDIITLLKEHYQTYTKSRVSLTQEQLSGYLIHGWIGIAIYDRGTLNGVVFSRPLGSLVIKDKLLEGEAGLVDFFCVSNQKRKSGIGSKLLEALFYETSLRKRYSHIFQKEGSPLLWIPHIWSGQYYWRKKKESPSVLGMGMYFTKIKQTSFQQQNHTSICYNIPSTNTINHTDIYKCICPVGEMYIAIFNTIHMSVPEGKRIGEIAWIQGSTIPDSYYNTFVEYISDICGYDILLSDSSYIKDKTTWIKDDRYSYYIFNVNPCKFFNMNVALTL